MKLSFTILIIIKSLIFYSQCSPIVFGLNFNKNWYELTNNSKAEYYLKNENKLSVETSNTFPFVVSDFSYSAKNIIPELQSILLTEFIVGFPNNSIDKIDLLTPEFFIMSKTYDSSTRFYEEAVFDRRKIEAIISTVFSNRAILFDDENAYAVSWSNDCYSIFLSSRFDDHELILIINKSTSKLKPVINSSGRLYFDNLSGQKHNTKNYFVLKPPSDITKYSEIKIFCHEQILTNYELSDREQNNLFGPVKSIKTFSDNELRSYLEYNIDGKILREKSFSPYGEIIKNSQFNYDSKKRLKKIQSFDLSDKIIFDETYYYNDYNKVSSIIKRNNQGKTIETQNYSFDKKLRLINIKCVNSYNKVIYNTKLYYDSKSNIIKIEYQNMERNFKNIYQYVYAEAGNYILEEIIINGETLKPFYHRVDSYHFGRIQQSSHLDNGFNVQSQQLFNYNESNMLVSRFDGETNKYYYTYNEFGDIIKSIQYTFKNGKCILTTTERFIYDIHGNWIESEWSQNNSVYKKTIKREISYYE